MSSIVRLVPRLVLIGAVGLLAFAVLLFAFRAVYADKVYPAVVVGDVPVGGKTVDQAVAAVEQRATELERGTVTFTHGGQVWTPTLAELGATVDVDGSVEAAYALGRDDNAVERLGFTNALLRDDQQVPLRTTVDRGQLEAWFAQVNGEMDQRAVDATLVVEGTAVRIEPEQTGTIVDEAAATDMILGTLHSLHPISSELPVMVEQPQIYASDLHDAEAQLTQAFSGPVVVTFEGHKWDLDAAELSPFVKVDIAQDAGSASVTVRLHEEQMAEYLRTTFSGEVNRSPKDARVAWRAGEGLVALDPSVDGITLRSDAFVEAVGQSFLGDRQVVGIPVVVTSPGIDSNNLAVLKINSLLGRGDSYYGGQKEERDHNVERGTELLNGTLVAPGEEFSFNGAIGEITAERGYVESGVIVAERAGRDVGGGICQVSTTVFRATIFAGLPITDWAPHTARLMIYEEEGWQAGYDASILQIGPDPAQWGDFKFRNDTGGHVLVQSWTDYPHVTVEIYGNDDGREVVVGEAQHWEKDSDMAAIEVVDATRPAGFVEQTEWPREGLDALFSVTVTYADGESREQEFYSPYQGHGDVWTVSPDMEGQSPAG